MTSDSIGSSFWRNILIRQCSSQLTLLVCAR
ncbi:unnamed protein product, partial [Rotaria magnacalcarata]